MSNLREGKSTGTPTPASEKPKVPNVRVIQEAQDEPVRVTVVQDKNEPSLRAFATVIFLASFLGTIIGLVVDSGELLDTVATFQEILNPPPTLCIAGSNTMLGPSAMGDAWKSGFEELNPEIRISFDDPGSVEGAQQAIRGECVHVLAMSEPMPQSVYEQLIGAGYTLDCAAEVGFDVIAFVTNINNPIVREVRDPDLPGDTRPRVRPIDDREMRQVLRGDISNWGELVNWPSGSTARPITVYARIGSGTTDVVLRRWIGFTAVEGQPFPPEANYQDCRDNLECLNETLSTPGALYWVSVAWMRTQPVDYLKVLSILQGDEASVNPLVETVDLEEYPSQLVRPLYLFVLDHERYSDEINQYARDFLTFARGVQGQQAVDASGFYNHFSRPVDIDVEFPETSFTVQGGSTRSICKP